MSKLSEQREWLDELRPGSVAGLFEFLPNTLYFTKDENFHLMVGNRALVERCGFERQEEMIGKLDEEIFPIELAEKFISDDRKVVSSGKPLLDIVELFPNQLGHPEWFITDKIPLFYRSGEPAGLCGIVRSFEGAHASLQPYLDLLPVTEFLKENFQRKVSMEDLAIMAGMSVRKLQRRFGKTFGTTVQDHVARLRILKACDLLVNTPMPVTEIAGQVGFYDHSAFSRKFSNKMGVSPRAYRMRRTLGP